VNRSDVHNDDPSVVEMHLPGSTGELPAQVYDCWSTIGVTGNGTCRELQKFVHCRNCPVYSAAGIQLLDRPMPTEYRRERTGHYAERKKVTQPAKISVLVFRLGPEWLALPTSAFQEVAERRSMHSLPHRGGSIVLGLVNVRGELLICVSLARLLGLVAEATRGKSLTIFDRLLVINWDGKRITFPVNEVHGVQRFNREEIKEPPATITKSTLTYTRGIFVWRERSIGFLDPDPLFSTLNRNLS
jgi:chemotaxis-related protein WspD